MLKSCYYILLGLVFLFCHLPAYAGEHGVWESIPVEFGSKQLEQTDQALETVVRNILQGWTNADYSIFDEIYAGDTPEESEANVDKLFSVYKSSASIKLLTKKAVIIEDHDIIHLTLQMEADIRNVGLKPLELELLLKKEKHNYKIITHKFIPEIDTLIPASSTYLGKIIWQTELRNNVYVKDVENVTGYFSIALNSRRIQDFNNILEFPTLQEEQKAIEELTALPYFIREVKTAEAIFNVLDEYHVQAQLKHSVYIAASNTPLQVKQFLNITFNNGKWHISDIDTKPSFASLGVTGEKDFGYLKVSCTVSPLNKDRIERLIEIVKGSYDFYKELCGRANSHHIEILEHANLQVDGVASPFGILLHSKTFGDLEYILAHEIAHLFSWPDENTLIPEAWLNEGMNDFFAYYFLQKGFGMSEYVKQRRILMCNCLATPDFKEINEFALADLTHENGMPPNAERIYYHKGSYVLEMLRQTLGDDMFNNVLREFYKNHHLITAKNLESTVNNVTGKNYSCFFEQWVYRPGYPELSYDYEIEMSEGKSKVKVKIIQNREVYIMDLPFIIKTKQEMKSYVLALSKMKQEWVFEVDGEIEEVLLDPEYRFFKRIERINSINKSL